MDKLACRIVPSVPKTVVFGAFTRDVGARVRLVAEWTSFRRGVSISLGDFAVMELAVYEFKEGGALLWNGVKLFVDGTSHRLEADPLELVCDEESPI